MRERQQDTARRLLDRADSIYLASDVLADWPVTNLVTARLREATGDLPGAARTIGRVQVALPVSPTYRSTYVREQARIGLEVGDTAGAVRALRRMWRFAPPRHRRSEPRPTPPAGCSRGSSGANAARSGSTAPAGSGGSRRARQRFAERSVEGSMPRGSR